MEEKRLGVVELTADQLSRSWIVARVHCCNRAGAECWDCPNRPETIKPTYPDRLMIRDTMLHDDMGGLGQRIYTTAGQGYERVEYIRADLIAMKTVPDPIAILAKEEPTC